MDAALLSRWMDSCDAEAFRELAQKYMPMVYATCLRILREPADAEDITQECFETLAGIRKNAPSQLGPWLHRVATNRCLNLIRSNNRRTQREQASSQNGEHASAPSYDEVYAHVDACIADLPEQYRLPLLLHFFDGQTHDAIAQSLGISRSAVSHRIAHAVQRIREQLLRRGCITTVIVLGASLDAIRAHAVMVPVTLEQAVAKLAISGITHASAAQASVAGLTLGALVMTTAQKMIVGVCAIAAVITVAALLTQSKKTATPPKQAVLVPPPPAQTVTPETKPQKPAVSLAKAEIRPELIPKPVEKSTQPVGHLSVYVYDEAGAPAPGAKLTLQYSESTESDQTLAATFEATTDAEGFANLNDLPQGWAWLVAERGNTRSEQRRTAFLPDMYSQELALFLHRTGKIAGKVLNDEGQPLAGARVVVFEKDLSQSSTIEGCPDAQDTNSDGRFEFTNLPVGLYRFRAIAEGYAPGDSDAVTTDSNAEAVVRVALGSSIAGVVRDGVTHNVLPDFPIRMLAKDSNESSRSVETDSAGNFLIQELQEGTYVLSSGHDAMFFADGRIEVTVPRAAPVSGLEITAQTGVAVRGRVLREKTQTPVANAIVRASHATNKSISRKSAETDEAGHYEIAGLAPGQISSTFSWEEQTCQRESRSPSLKTASRRNSISIYPKPLWWMVWFWINAASLSQVLLSKQGLGNLAAWDKKAWGAR
ncbi:MAG: sigma-70 family RNA polymerase sigma factor [Candidatus Hydrogenedentes bacterium]|nr:sigma-70 family RNA polymerase sigma factor [Candidatus Hydrogenedentota bacterium]